MFVSNKSKIDCFVFGEILSDFILILETPKCWDTALPQC